MRRVFFAVLLVSSAVYGGVNTWTSSGPLGGTIWSLATVPGNTSLAFAGTEGALFKTTNGGASWAPVTSFPAPFVTTVKFDPTNQARIFAGTSENGLYLSTDGGATWTKLSLFDAELYPPQITALEVHPAAPNKVYVAAGGYLYDSMDSGATWSSAITTLPTYGEIWSIAGDPSNANTVYSCTKAFDADSSLTHLDGVYKSTDSGATWTAANTGLPASGSGHYRPWQLKIDARTTPQTLYVATQEGGLAKSTNGATSWTTMIPLRPEGYYPSGFSVLLDPSSASIITVGRTNGFERTTDGGATWTRLDMPAGSGNYFGAMAALGTAPSTLLAGNNSTMMRSTDAGATWAVARSGLNAWRVDSVVYDAATSTLYAPGRDAIVKSTDNGATWSSPINLDSYEIIGVGIGPSNTLYSGLFFEGCRFVGSGTQFGKSTDGGATWTTYDFNLDGTRITSMRVHPTNPNIVFILNDSGDLMKSTDGGGTWTHAGSGLYGGSRFPSMAFDPANPSVMWVASGALYKSTDGGVTFTNPADGGGFSPLDANAVAVDPANSNRILAGDTNDVWESTDGGVTWTTLGVPWDNWTYMALDVRKILFDPSHAGTIYAASAYAGVYKSTDGGVTWSPMNSGLNDTRVVDLTFGANSGTLFAATPGSGVYAFTLSSIAAPAGVEATANGATVSVTCSRHASAVSYRVYRRGPGGGTTYSLVGSVPQPASGNPTYGDTTAVAGAAYLYTMSALAADGSESATGSPDLATTVTFTDPALAAGVAVKAAHLAELRNAVNVVRTLANLSTETFTDPTLSPSVAVKRTHLVELRTALDQARSALALPPISYVDDPTITAGTTPIRASHITAVRQGVQ